MSAATAQDTTKDTQSEGATNTVVQKKKSKASRILLILRAYTKYAGSSFYQDKLIKVVQYTLWFISRFYVGTSTEKGLMQLSGDLSWARYVTRLFELPAAVEAVQSGSWCPQNKTLGRAMALSMIAYYPLEYLSFFKWRAPYWVAPSFQSEHRLAERASAWSCRFWTIFIAMDIVKSLVALHPADVPASDKKRERLQLLRSALFALPAIHWSLPNWDRQPWLSDTTCNGLMWLETLVGLYQTFPAIEDKQD
eukprot:Nitzschia sp. Nitz4//scaffold444_size6782//5290//6042//NITZ4_009170-RA/size6782-processed-gene-0.0-mRNA-1//1//CDS//3329552049//8323//frame0